MAGLFVYIKEEILLYEIFRGTGRSLIMMYINGLFSPPI